MYTSESLTKKIIECLAKRDIHVTTVVPVKLLADEMIVETEDGSYSVSYKKLAE